MTKSIKKLIIIAALVVGLGSPLFSQFYSYYYGKNRIPQGKFKWKFVETEHFKVYHYSDDQKIVKKISRASEAAYSQISNYLNVKIKKKIPLIYYTTRIDFYQNNITGYIPFGVVAFAESSTYRVVVQGDEAYDDLVVTITHELGHIFEYEILGKGLRAARAPGWVMEGFADFITHHWNDFNLLTVRDGVLSGQIPQMDRYGRLIIPGGGGRGIYDFGHLVFDFLDQKYGRRGIKKFLYAQRRSPIFAGRRNVMKIFDLSPKIFNFEFGKYTRNRFKKFFLKETPEDYSYQVGPEFPFFHTFSHDVSPSGEMVAIMSLSAETYKMELALVSLKDGKVIKTITPGYTRKYDDLFTKYYPAAGHGFSWNKDSNLIAMFARKDYRTYLVVVDILTKNIVKRIRVKSEQEPTSLRYLPGSNDILYYCAMDKTISYIYSIDLRTGESTKLSDGYRSISALDISADGKNIVYAANADGYSKIFLAPLQSLNKPKQLTGGKFNDIAPSFSRDGKRVYYSSAERESYNLYGIDLEKKTRSRYTDVRTGVFLPLEIPESEGEVLISTYHKGAFSLYKKDVSKAQEETPLVFRDVEALDTARKKVEEQEGKDLEEFKIIRQGKYKPLKKLVVRSRPNIGVGYGTNGGFMGSSSVTVTDLMGDHNFSLHLSSFYGYRSYMASYLNRKSRLMFYARMFSFRDVYYTAYDYRFWQTLRAMFGGEAGFYYALSPQYRMELTASLYHRNENYDNLAFGQNLPFGQYFDGMNAPVRFSLVGETTQFFRYGPNMGHTFKLTYEKYIKFSDDFMDAYSITADLRKYLRLGNETLLAFRFVGQHSGGEYPLLYATGGYNTIRSSDFRRMVGNSVFWANAEFRFPLVTAALTPIGVIGPVRGVFFFDIGGAWFKGQDFLFFEEGEGMRLRDAVSSYGFGVEFFMFGYPMHVEWIWKNNFTGKFMGKDNYQGVKFWIGFDF